MTYYDKKDRLRMAAQMERRGYSRSQIAHWLGIHRSTLYRWMNDSGGVRYIIRRRRRTRG